MSPLFKLILISSFVILFVSPSVLRASDPRRVNHYDEQYNPIVIGHDELDEDLQDFHTTRSLFENLREFLRKYPAVIPQVFNYLTNEPLFSENPAVVEELNGALIELQRPDLSECPTCRTVLRVMRILLRQYTYEKLEDPAVVICNLGYSFVDGAPALQFRRELCNGSVRIQGPHVAAVIGSNSTITRICEFQNTCLPPIQSRAIHKQTQLKTQPPRPKLQPPRPKQDSIKVMQISDVHVDVRYKEGSRTDCGLPICCIHDSPLPSQPKSGQYGDYRCNIPPRTIDVFMQKIASDLTPDFILYSGDISGSRVWDETQDEILNCTSALINSISANIPNVTAFPALGNHEMFPTNLFYKGLPDVENLLNHISDWWAPVARFDARQIETMKKGGYYSTLVRPKLRIICYNSNFMYTNNWYNVFNHDVRTDMSDMMTFLTTELDQAKSNNEKVILLTHHPTSSGDYLLGSAYQYQKIVLDYSDIIVLQVSGHKHSDQFQLISDTETNIVESMLFLSPPVTAGGTKNPSLRIYHLDPTDFHLVDYDQYYFDMKLSQGPSGIAPEIKLLYSAKEEYNLTDLSPSSWRKFVDRLETDDQLLLRHVNHYYIGSRGYTSCTDTCKSHHLCALRHTTYDMYQECRSSYDDPPTTTTTTTTTTPLPTDSGAMGRTGIRWVTFLPMLLIIGRYII